MLLDDPVHELLRLLAVGDIAGQDRRIDLMRAQILLRALQLGLIARHQYHTGAETPELTRQQQAEATGPAGDHHDAALEPNRPPAPDGFCGEQRADQHPAGRECGISSDHELARRNTNASDAAWSVHLTGIYGDDPSGEMSTKVFAILP